MTSPVRSRLLHVLPVLAFLAVLVGFGLGLRHDPAAVPSQLIGKPLPGFVLPSLSTDRAPLRAAGLRGPLLLNVFASWCVPCAQEHPVLMEIAAGQQVPLYGLNWKDTPAAGAAWLQARGNPYVAVMSDVPGRAGIDMGVTGVPETYVIDRRGIVRYRYTGPLTLQTWHGELEPMLAQLRREP